MCDRIRSRTCAWEEMARGRLQGSWQQVGPKSRATIVETDASRSLYLPGSAFCTMGSWTERRSPSRWYLHINISGDIREEWHMHRPHACLPQGLASTG